MGTALADQDQLYLAFFDSVMNDNTISPPLEPRPSPPITPSPTSSDLTTKALEERWWASTTRATALKTRLKQEKVQIGALVEAYQAGQCADIALRDRIATTTAWLDSMLRKFNSAVDDHQQRRVLTDVPLLRAKIRGIERKLLAVEVALQQGPERDSGHSGRDVVGGSEGEEESEIRPRDGLFSIEDAGVDRLELDDLHQRFFQVEGNDEGRQNTPAVGLFSVPKPTESWK